MTDAEKFYPTEENLGKECKYWGLGETAVNCCFPKIQLQGRTTCLGIIDDVCLRVKDGREASSFSEMLLLRTDTTPLNGALLPPGEIV
jgi:hypothetical protein